jgi:hypothetical protein
VRERGTRTGCTRGVVTTRWPHARRREGAAAPRSPADKVSQKRRCEHCESGGNAPGKVAVARAHPSSGLMCGDGAEAARHCPTVAEVLW